MWILLAFEQGVKVPSAWKLHHIGEEVPWTVLFQEDGTHLLLHRKIAEQDVIRLMFLHADPAELPWKHSIDVDTRVRSRVMMFMI